MSKAFTSDLDDEDDEVEMPAFPAGIRNYMTPAGADRLRGEVERLTAERRLQPKDLEGNARILKIERRLRYLMPRLDALDVIDPLRQPNGSVLFGATVTVSDERGKTERWRIVGLDEADLDRGWISWMSPLATALLEKREGESVPFMGRRLGVLKITYES